MRKFCTVLVFMLILTSCGWRGTYTAERFEKETGISVARGSAYQDSYSRYFETDYTSVTRILKDYGDVTETGTPGEYTSLYHGDLYSVDDNFQTISVMLGYNKKNRCKTEVNFYCNQEGDFSSIEETKSELDEDVYSNDQIYYETVSAMLKSYGAAEKTKSQGLKQLTWNIDGVSFNLSKSKDGSTVMVLKPIA